MKRIVIFGLVAALAGCATSQYRPIVDLQGADPYLYEEDLADCQSYARQVDPGVRHIVQTRTFDVDCPACAAAAGTRCQGAFCRPRVNLAAARTREANRRARDAR